MGGKKNKTITALSGTLYLPAGYCKCFSNNYVMCCVLPAFSYLMLQAAEMLKAESGWVERWLRQREAISHSANTCCSTSVTNSRAECLLSVNESLIRCTMEMGRRVCGPCCFLHQCLGLSQTAPHESGSHLQWQESERAQTCLSFSSLPNCSPVFIHQDRSTQSYLKVQISINILTDWKGHLSFFH